MQIMSHDFSKFKIPDLALFTDSSGTKSYKSVNPVKNYILKFKNGQSRI